MNGLPCLWLYRNRIRPGMSNWIEGFAQCCHKNSTYDTRDAVLAAWQLAVLRGQDCSKLSSCGTRNGNKDSVKRSKDWYLHIWVNVFIAMSPDISGPFQVQNSARVKSPIFLSLCFSFNFNHNYIKHIDKYVDLIQIWRHEQPTLQCLMDQYFDELVQRSCSFPLTQRRVYLP